MAHGRLLVALEDILEDILEGILEGVQNTSLGMELLLDWLFVLWSCMIYRPPSLPAI